MNNLQMDLLNYRVVGNGRPVVFLHGFLESISMWEQIRVPDNVRAIMIDLPGHGASEAACLYTETIYEMALAVKQVLDALEVQEYDVIGHSMGGYVALEMKVMDQRCGRIMLLNSNFWEDDAEKKLNRERVAKIVKSNKKLFVYEAIPNLFMDPETCGSVVESLINEAVEINSEAIAKASIAMKNRRGFENEIHSFGDALWVVQGRCDTIVDKEVMIRKLKGSDVVFEVIDGVGHMAHVEASQKVGEIVERFVNEKRKL